jgi:hypothetical protein
MGFDLIFESIVDMGSKPTLFPAQLEVNGFIELPVNIEHLYAFESDCLCITAILSTA